MQLPEDLALEIPDAKITDYLLSDQHPIGRLKARWFRRQGYTPDSLKQALTDVARTGNIKSEETTEFGLKYEVRDSLVTPAGASITLTTVWMHRKETSELWFVTAYPSK